VEKILDVVLLSFEMRKRRIEEEAVVDD